MKEEKEFKELLERTMILQEKSENKQLNDSELAELETELDSIMEKMTSLIENLK